MLPLHQLNVTDVSTALSCVRSAPGLWRALRQRALHDARHASSLLAAARELHAVVDEHSAAAVPRYVTVCNGM